MRCLLTIFPLPFCVALLHANGDETKPAAPTEKGYLGVHVVDVPDAVRAQIELAEGKGLQIDFLVEGSAAAQGGLRLHDILLKLDDQWLINQEQLARLLENAGAGRVIDIVYMRKGKTATAKITLQAMPPKLQEPQVGSEAAAGESWEDLLGSLAKSPELAKLIAGFKKLQRKPIKELIPEIGTLKDKLGTVEILEKDGEFVAKISSPDGKTLFEGPITTPEDQAKVPAEYWMRIEALQDLRKRISGQ